MNVFSRRTMRGVGVLALICWSVTAATAQTATSRIVSAAKTFLSTLDATAAPGTNITAYYRIQGPHLVIEYAPQRLGGNPSMHVHTMYRDPTNDYGRGLAAK